MKKIVTSACLLFCFLFVSNSHSYGQVWTTQKINFPVATQTWKIYPVNDSIAWTHGWALDSATLNWSTKNFYFYRTADGGKTWQTGTFPHTEPGYLTCLKPITDQVAYITYASFIDGNHLLKTMDGGKTWAEQTITVNNFINMVYLFGNGAGIMQGDPGADLEFEIFTKSSTNDQWQRVDAAKIPNALPDEFALADDYDAAGNHIFFMTTQGRIYYSPDQGATWNVWEKPTGAKGFPFGVMTDIDGYCYFAFNDVSTIPVNSYQLYRRKIGENDWTNITQPDNVAFILGYCAIPGTQTLIANFAIGSPKEGRIETRLSYDRGANWKTIYTGTGDQRPTFVRFANAQTGYAAQPPYIFNVAESHKHIFKYVGSPLVGLLTPQSLDIDISIAPNPAAQFIRVQFETAAADDYWLLLNDAQGRLLKRCELPQTRVVSHTFDIGHLPAGLYTLTVSSAKGSVARVVAKGE